MKVYLLIALCITSASFAQRFSRDSRTYIDFGEPLKGACYQNATGDSVVVTLNTASTLFSFIKSEKKHRDKGAYFAVREMNIEIRERPAGSIVTSKNIRDTIYAHTFEESTNKNHWYPYVTTLALGSSETFAKLEGKLEVRDGFLSRLAFRPIVIDLIRNEFHRTRSLTQKDTSIIGIGDVILYDRELSSDVFSSMNFGKTYGFSKDITGIVPLALGAGSPPLTALEITLYQTGDLFEDRYETPKAVVSQNISLEEIRWDTKLRASPIDDTMLTWNLDPSSDTSINFGHALFRIAGAKLGQGKYLLEVRATVDNITRRQSSEFELDWFDMPLSLFDPRDALPPMQYIVSEETFDSLDDGNRKNQMQKIFDYWSRQDPTPSTAYNERMAEFFKRADYAYFNFAQSARSYDGAMTDRGKIYILYGAPTNIQRTFLIGEDATETWTYSNKVKKSFIFTDDTGRGEYKLKDIKAL